MPGEAEVAVQRAPASEGGAAGADAEDPEQSPQYIDNLFESVAGPALLNGATTFYWKGGKVTIPLADLGQDESATYVAIWQVHNSKAEALKTISSYPASKAFSYYSFYRGPGGVILPTSFSSRSTPKFHALWPELKRLQAEDAQDIANGLQQLANSINPFPCTQVNEQGELTASINFSSCALPLLLHAYSIHSATRGSRAGAREQAAETGSEKAPGTAKEPVTSKGAVTPAEEGVGARVTEKANTLAEVPTEGGHTLRVGKGGLVEVCSNCVNISLVYKKTLAQNPELAKDFRDIQTKARQAEEMIGSGDAKVRAKGESQAKAAARDAVRLQNNLAGTGITEGGTRYRPEPDLLGEGTHGVGWKDADAATRANRTGKPQGRFGGLEDLQFAAEQAAKLGPGKETAPPYVPLPANTSSVVFMPNQKNPVPATRLYIKVRANGSFHAYPL